MKAATRSGDNAGSHDALPVYLPLPLVKVGIDRSFTISAIFTVT